LLCFRHSEHFAFSPTNSQTTKAPAAVPTKPMTTAAIPPIPNKSTFPIAALLLVGLGLLEELPPVTLTLPLPLLLGAVEVAELEVAELEPEAVVEADLDPEEVEPDLLTLAVLDVSAAELDGRKVPDVAVPVAERWAAPHSALCKASAAWISFGHSASKHSLESSWN